MFKFAIPAVAALGLIAAAAQPRATTVAEDQAAAPMGWHLSHEGAMAKLAYGVANSDHLALMMTCVPGRTLATVYGDVQPASPRLVRASTDTAIDPLSGGLADESRIALGDPTLQKLLRRGTLEVEGDAGHFELTASGDDHRVIQRFFAYCETSAA